MRPVLLATSAPPGAFIKDKSLLGQCVTSLAGNLLLGPRPGSWAAVCLVLNRAARHAQGLLDLILLLLAELGLELSVLASAGHPPVPGTRRGTWF